MEKTFKVVKKDHLYGRRVKVYLPVCRGKSRIHGD